MVNINNSYKFTVFVENKTTESIQFKQFIPNSVYLQNTDNNAFINKNSITCRIQTSFLHKIYKYWCKTKTMTVFYI